MSVRRKALTPAVWGMYLVIVLEFLFMISPIAFHFYSSYGPVLNVFHGSRSTAWLTGFFLPHFSETTSWTLNMTKPLGFQLGYLGLLFFLLGAAQVYTAKILRRGAVTGGLYRWVRHPQYLALGILGLGVTLIWPRFLVLITYVTMLFLYVALARREEKLCLGKYGESYRRLQERTGMFVPRALEKFVVRERSKGQPVGVYRIVVLYVVAMAVALGTAFCLREFSLHHITSHFTGKTAFVSPALLSHQELEIAFQLANSDEMLQEELRQVGATVPVLVFVVPEEWYLPDLPLHSIEEIRQIGGGHRTPDDFDRERYKLLFTSVRTHKPDATGRDIIRTGYGLDPILIVHVNLGSNEIVSRTIPPATVVWGDIPTPLF